MKYITYSMIFFSLVNKFKNMDRMNEKVILCSSIIMFMGSFTLDWNLSKST